MDVQEQKGKPYWVIFMAVFAVFVMQGSNSILSAGINSVAEAFPNVPLAIVMSISSIPALFVIFSSIIAGRLAGDKVKYKTLILIALAIIVVAGILPAFLSNFTGILLCRVLLGIGVGVIYSLAPALVLRLFDGNKRGNVMGLGQFCATGGGMVMQLCVGFLAVMSWRYIFFVYLLAVLCLILVLFGLEEPERIKKTKPDSVNKVSPMKLPFKVYFNGVVAILFMLLSFPVIISVSSIIDTRQLGTGVQAGFALTLFNIGGLVLTVGFGKLYQLLKKWTIIFILVLTITSIALVSSATTLWMLYVGMVLFGSGLLVLPTLVMDCGRDLPVEQVTFASGLMVACMNVGVFFASSFVGVILKIVGSEAVTAPLRFSMICLGVLAVLLALIKLKKWPIGPKTRGE